MKANETTLEDLLSGKKQYQIPLYQRTYSWGEPQFGQLWDDVVDLAEALVDRADASHFIGSLVLAPSPALSATGVQEWLVVDGQQRLTTLTILLAAIRDHLASEDPEARDRIDEQYLVNKFAKGDARYKLSPTQLDRPYYFAIVGSAPEAGKGDGVGAAYRYFRSRLQEIDDPEDPHDIARIERAITSHLSLVVITAHVGDNVHRIFESINNTGVRLSQADLLRNYFFMRMPTRGERAYHELWLPMQDALTTEQLEVVLWLDMLLRGNERARREDIYRDQQARLEKLPDEDALFEELVALGRRASLFRTVIEPSREANPEVREGLARLAEWGIQYVQPPSVRLLELRDAGVATNDQVAMALRYLEGYLVRRLLVGRGSQNIGRILMALPGALTAIAPVEEEVKRFLSAPRRFWPSDAEIVDAVVNNAFYWQGRGGQRNYILRGLEESFGSKEPVDMTKLTIEHVLPQHPGETWLEVLAAYTEPGQTPTALHQTLVHTLGNLTLTGYNSTLSNRPFEAKREELRRSGLRMNQEIASLDDWTPDAIRERGRRLAQRCIELWPGPDGSERASETSAFGARLGAALAAMPPGTWTTYGDLAEVLGSHAVAVGSALATTPDVPAPWRVLNASGRVAGNFRWLEPGREDDPSELLRAEGVHFLADGTANPSQRLLAADLADLLGLEQVDGAAGMDPLTDAPRRAEFDDVLSARQPPEVVAGVQRLLSAWVDAGGRVVHGSGKQPSAILKLLPFSHDAYMLWCGAIYPEMSSLQIWFLFLRTKEPFVDPTLREELRQRLNAAPGVDIPESKLSLRPRIPLAALADGACVAALTDALAWLTATARDRLIATAASAGGGQ